MRDNRQSSARSSRLGTGTRICWPQSRNPLFWATWRSRATHLGECATDYPDVSRRGYRRARLGSGAERPPFFHRWHFLFLPGPSRSGTDAHLWPIDVNLSFIHIYFFFVAPPAAAIMLTANSSWSVSG